MSLIIKNYEDNNYNDLKDMMFCLYTQDPSSILMTDAKVNSTICQSKSHPDKIHILMIYSENEVAGYGVIVFFWSNEYGGDIVCIDELYVRQEYRNKGLASEFLLCQKTAHKNAVALRIETTPSNIAVRKLYQRHGFQPAPNNHMILRLRED
jgi:GNAT superfamily N-acetyltransferase